MQKLVDVSRQDERLVAGLMSGTSLDGVNVAIARLKGSGKTLSYELLAYTYRTFTSALRQSLLDNSAPETSSVRAISQLNVHLAHVYAEALEAGLKEAGLQQNELDLVGTHGQTIHHVPQAESCAGRDITSTLQIGDGSVLANLCDTTVVSDFRMADMALGGQGAPLVPYFDYIAFSDADETRALLNLGGIANLTILPPGAEQDEVFAFDTGPANMIIDALAVRYYGRDYDENGDIAGTGEPDKSLLADLLEEGYFLREPPKSTGREHYGKEYVNELIERAEQRGIEPPDLIATATALTAYSVYQAYARFIRDDYALDKLIVSGGGVHNRTIMRLLNEAFSPIRVETVADYGLDPDAKEALCFAVLAHETINGTPANLPASTGASRPALLGKICVPR